MMHQSAKAWNLQSPITKAFCAMLAYAEFHGEPGIYNNGEFKWQKLATAAEQCCIPIDGALHRALADTMLLRQIVLHMAEWKES
jgi:DNA polymerase III epsilon subunit-like protein